MDRAVECDTNWSLREGVLEVSQQWNMLQLVWVGEYGRKRATERVGGCKSACVWVNLNADPWRERLETLFTGVVPVSHAHTQLPMSFLLAQCVDFGNGNFHHQSKILPLFTTSNGQFDYNLYLSQDIFEPRWPLRGQPAVVRGGRGSDSA
jgi:hypothetical protein